MVFSERITGWIVGFALVLPVATATIPVIQSQVFVDPQGLPLGHSGKFKCPSCGEEAGLYGESSVRCYTCRKQYSVDTLLY